MDKLEGIKPGDRVKMTIEADYIGPLVGHDISRFLVQGAVYEFQIVHKDTGSIHHIERIEKPLAVGDRVRGVTSGDAGKIVWMSDTHVVIVGSSYPCPLVKHISNVERIS